MSTAKNLPSALCQLIDESGFFPELITEVVSQAVGAEEVIDFVVQHEASVVPDAVIRHLTVIVLTPTRLVMNHTDEDTDPAGRGTAITATETVPLRRLGTVSITRVITHPEDYGSSRSGVVETWLTMGWGQSRHLSLIPAHCGDPNCDAEHGVEGEADQEDITLRMSPAADGPDNVARLVHFATTIQQHLAVINA